MPGAMQRPCFFGCQVRMRFYFSLALFCSILLCSCFRQAYYVSPFNGMTAPYRTIPLHTDSMKAASYLNLQLFTGESNQQGRDRKQAVSLDFSRSHNFGVFQAYYGLGFTAGNYHAVGMDTATTGFGLYYGSLSPKRSNYFFGGAGADAGANVVAPFNGGEWRIFGVEASVRQEFGDYVGARKAVPDSHGAVVIPDKFFGSSGVYSEVLVDAGSGSFVGLRLSEGRAFGHKYHNLDVSRDTAFGNASVRFNYFNLNLHYTHERFTAYVQFGTAGKSDHVLAGVNYRLGR